MFKALLNIAIRNLLKNRTYTIINVLGLSIGLASFILISLYVRDELSYDKHNSKADRIYRVIHKGNFDGVIEESSSCPFPVGPTLKEQFPHIIEEQVRFFNLQFDKVLIQNGDKNFVENNFYFADSTVFKVFDYKFIQGDSKTALNAPFSVVISKSMAEKYFKGTNPIGKELTYEKVIKFNVTGVFEDVSPQSHFKQDFIASMASVRKLYGGSLPNTWVWNPCWTYILLNPKASIVSFQTFMSDFVEKNFVDAQRGNTQLYFQPLLDIHLGKSLDYEIEPAHEMRYINMLIAISIFLLLIASINFINLATALSANRAKEIGIKKVLGAERKQLIIAYLFEAIFLSFLALVVSLIIVELSMPYFNVLTSKHFDSSSIVCSYNIILVIGIAFITGIISGLYPAFYLSSFSPILILKGKLRIGTNNNFLRKFLVITQFVISIVLIIITLIVFKQSTYMTKADLGFNKDDILVVRVLNTPIAANYNIFKQELLKNPQIYSVTTSDYILGQNHNTHEFRPEGYANDKWKFYPAIIVSYDFVKTYNLKIVAGRDFDENMKTDPQNGILINESMVKLMGWKSPQNALGKKFSSLRGNEKVIGVLKDFHVKSLHTPIGPFVLNIKEEKWEVEHFTKYLAINIKSNDKQEVVKQIEKVWNEYAPNYPFQYTFQADELKKMYESENDLGELSAIFTLILIIIAALGLYGLTSFLIVKRSKEIGVRKVFGADVYDIVKMVYKEFVLIIGVSIIISFPVAYIFCNQWLSKFPYHIKMDVYPFIIAAGIAIFTGLITVLYHAIKAAKTNTIDALRYE
ncbi:MAG: FtsX-like permease family protein [Bacteroidota bacterium]